MFRGVSIILVVFSHCYLVGNSSFGYNLNVLSLLFKTICSGASAFFVFISGYLFVKQYKSSSSLKGFLIRKLRYVFSPFLFFSSFDLLYILFRFILSNLNNSALCQFYHDALISYDFISCYLVGHSYATLGILWYIPFIMLVYSLSPVFLFYSKIRFKWKIRLFLFSILVSLLLFRNSSREVHSVFHNVLYFTPFYFVGILSYQYRNVVLKKCHGNKVLLLILFSLFFSFMNIFLRDSISTMIDFLLLQKLSLCLVFLNVFNRMQRNTFSIINLLATNSYGI